MTIADVLSRLDKSIEENRELALKHGKLTEAIENLLSLEKQTRLAEHLAGTSQLALAIVDLCRDAASWKDLNAQIVVLSKRRAQLKQVIQRVVQRAMEALDSTPDKDTKLELIATLRTVTAGKIFVEIERARLTRILAKIQEDDGQVADAAETLQEVQVETFGGMDKREKLEFLLEQVRLLLEKNDHLRAQIISKKISPKALADPDFQDLKIRFHRLMIRHASHLNTYLDMARSYHAIYSTPSIQGDKAKWTEELKYVAVLLVLSPHDNEQSDFVNRVYEDKNLLQIPTYRNLIKYFVSMELVRWPLLQEMYTPELSALDLFQGDSGKQRWTDLAKRVVEHNIRIISNYYGRITASRLSQLLDLSPEDTEKNVSEMVASKALYARIDRPAGIVSFTKPKQPAEVLNDWATNISNLLDLIESSCHLIHKENMVYKIDA